MIGIKRTEYTVTNDEVGKAFKEKFLRTYDVISITENKQIIVITVGETFDTNDFMWS